MLNSLSVDLSNYSQNYKQFLEPVTVSLYQPLHYSLPLPSPKHPFLCLVSDPSHINMKLRMVENQFSVQDLIHWWLCTSAGRLSMIQLTLAGHQVNMDNILFADNFVHVLGCKYANNSGLHANLRQVKTILFWLKSSSNQLKNHKPQIK